ncbi:MAG: Gfo/Idh/MocA family oxidoreductase, partial [Pirellulaceae bacterium]|nr:Gfo/Idh/MocA family oxidoreductase [Pirellulaceae bacterium]
MKRRQFLQVAAAAAAGVQIVPRRVLGGANAVAPSERIAMGFIGLGGQGTGHLLGGAWTYVPGGYIARDDVQVLAVCDVRKERREPVHQRCNQIYADKFGPAGYHGVQAYNDFREVLARPDIDAVLLALPYHWAGLMAAMAMRAGKDVYCEKPICTTVREGRNLVETCRRFGRIYQAGMQQRSEYDGKFRQACDLVRNGRIGKLQEVYAYRSPGAFFPTGWTSDDSQPVPEGFDWDLWLGPLPWRPYAGGAGHALNGFFIGDVNWSPHHYDIVRWTVNPEDTETVEAWPENGTVHYRFANGVVIHSTGYPGENVGPDGGACFVGSEGRIAVDRSNIVSYPASILKEPLHPGDSRVYHSSSHSGNFLDCIRTRRPTIGNPQTAVDSMTLILAGGGTQGQVGPGARRVPGRRPSQSPAFLHAAAALETVIEAARPSACILPCFSRLKDNLMNRLRWTRVFFAGLVALAAARADADEEQDLLATLQASVGVPQKCAACQQLRVIGTA